MGPPFRVPPGRLALGLVALQIPILANCARDKARDKDRVIPSAFCSSKGP